MLLIISRAITGCQWCNLQSSLGLRWRINSLHNPLHRSFRVVLVNRLGLPPELCEQPLGYITCELALDQHAFRCYQDCTVVNGVSQRLIRLGDGATDQAPAVGGQGLRQMLADTPDITVELISSEAEPGGVSELAVPPVAPAIANALQAATGYRLRRLPLTPGTV